MYAGDHANIFSENHLKYNTTGTCFYQWGTLPPSYYYDNIYSKREQEHEQEFPIDRNKCLCIIPLKK